MYIIYLIAESITIMTYIIKNGFTYTMLTLEVAMLIFPLSISFDHFQYFFLKIHTPKPNLFCHFFQKGA